MEAKFVGKHSGDIERGQGKARRVYSEVLFTRKADGSYVATGYTRDGGKSYLAACGKCAGTGHRDGFEHVENGRCWGCMGRGVIVPRAETLRDWLEGLA
jgi:DnaJ-class molecular chaperone